VVPYSMRWRRGAVGKWKRGLGVTNYRVGVVGGTGILGTELLHILEQRRFPIRTLNIYASDRSIGQRLPFGEGEISVERPLPGAFKHLDLVFLASGRGRDPRIDRRDTGGLAGEGAGRAYFRAPHRL